jgi:putative ABC transport system permease protein
MSVTKQVVALTAIGLQSIPHRSGNSSVIIIGTACVVAVLVSVLAMSVGFDRTVQGDARLDRVVLLMKGMDSEGQSALSREDVGLIQSAPEIKTTAEGKPILSAEVVLVAPVVRRNGTDAYITLRGAGERLFDLRPELKIVAGRMFKPGLRELIVGRAAEMQFQGLDLGSSLRLPEGDWTIVGIFSGGDNVRQSEVISDATTVMSAFKLDAFNSATAMLVRPDYLGQFQDTLNRDPSLSVDALPEPDYLAMVSKPMHRLLKTVAYAIGGIMAIGALFGALNTMYSAVAARIYEIATLRALGFSPSAVLGSVVSEAVLLSLTGACIGIGIAYAAFNGRAINTLGGSRADSQLVYSLAISPSLVIVATAVACGIGLLGGLLPAIRAVRISVVDALRAN